MAAARQTMPVLRYTPPANAFRATAGSVEDYAFNGCNASVQVYPFRTFTGDIHQAFQATLLRDWIEPQYQEENVAAPPNFQMTECAGADFVMAATFAENVVGLPKPHMRFLVVAGKAAAIVDAHAGTMQSWEIAAPSLSAMGDSIAVEQAEAPPPLSGEAGRAVAGLYQGIKQKYMATMINVTGSGYYTSALHYYLLSADGRVCRAYDQLSVPGGDIESFDFDAAERSDPGNSGRYTVAGGKLLVQIGGPSPESIVTDVPRNGQLRIYDVLYQRQ